MCLALCVMLMMAPLPARAEATGSFHRGFVLTSWKPDSYLLPPTDNALRRMAADGSNQAAIFTQWFMDGPGSSILAPDPARTPSDAAIVHAATTAREAGMNVTLKPQIGIRDGSWIGVAQPADPTTFWSGYRAMLLHYADLAEQVGATTLVIGTEMRTLSWDEAHWRPLIAEIRTHFHGALTYAANFDEFDRVPFWDALDFVGVDGYFELADESNPAPSAADLATAWTSRGHLARLAAVSRRTGRKVLFTEIGYRGGHTTAVHPGRWDIVDVPDPQAQANAYEAFYQAVALKPWVAGVYWWDVHPDERWIQDYSPLGKPAEQVLAAWNQRPDLGQGPDIPAPAPVTQAPPLPPPEPQASPPAARAAIDITLRGRRLVGSVAPYSAACPGKVWLQLRTRAGGRWRTMRAPRPFAPRGGGAFARSLRARPARARAVFRSRCSSARSGWAPNRA
jgi:hypothetical protein